MNVKLLRKIQKHILAEPLRFNMRWWKWQGIELERKVAEGVHPAVPPCGTVACIAGWAQELEAPKSRRNTASHATILLGLTFDQSMRLFTLPSHDPLPGEWPKKFARAYLSARTPRGRASAAVRRIDHFIATKGRE